MESCGNLSSKSFAGIMRKLKQGNYANQNGTLNNNPYFQELMRRVTRKENKAKKKTKLAKERSIRSLANNQAGSRMNGIYDSSSRLGRRLPGNFEGNSR